MYPFILIFFLFSCTSSNNFLWRSSLSQDTSAQELEHYHLRTSQGNLKIQVKEYKKKYESCFDIMMTLEKEEITPAHRKNGNPNLENADTQIIYPKNWNVAWIDRQDLFHFLKLRPKFPFNNLKTNKVSKSRQEGRIKTFETETCLPLDKRKSMKALTFSSKLPEVFRHGIITIKTPEKRLRSVN